jgi:hypothetical protein
MGRRQPAAFVIEEKSKTLVLERLSIIAKAAVGGDRCQRSPEIHSQAEGSSSSQCARMTLESRETGSLWMEIRSLARWCEGTRVALEVRGPALRRYALST